jgi:hypothetical protein
MCQQDGREFALFIGKSDREIDGMPSSAGDEFR